jgi:sporulation protein YlmC with PRC-barrel domain
MKTFVSLLTVAVVLALNSAAAKAEEKKKATLERSTDLINRVVVNKSGDHVGYLEDLTVELPSGRIVYAALSTKNALGLGGKLYALSYSAFHWSADRKSLVLDVKKDEFEKAEGFDAKSWPTHVDERWAKLGSKSAYMPPKDARVARVTSLTGLPVKNESGVNLGKVSGYGIDYEKERLSYAVMARGGVVGVGAKYFAIPWEALNLKSLALRVDDRSFVLNAAPQDFDDKDGFDFTNWPERGNERFLKNAKRTDK